jgi:hypothetical protein
MSDTGFMDEMATDPLALDEVMQYVNALERIRGEIDDAELMVKNLKDQEKRLSEEVLPSLLLDHGLEELKLANGKRLTVKESLYCRLPEDPEKRMTALQWLMDHGGGDKIKDEVILDEVTPELLDELSSLHASYQRKRTVHPASLQAWFKESLGLKKNSIARISIDDVPKEFGVFLRNECKLS